MGTPRGKVLEMEGAPVIDAKKTITIDVTARDVKSRGVKDPATCAVAQACKRAFKVAEARVYLTRTFLKVKGNWIRYRTPDSIRREIIAFDRGGKFEPGEHTLSPMPPALKLGARRAPGPKKTKGKKRRAYHITASVRDRPTLSA